MVPKQHVDAGAASSAPAPVDRVLDLRGERCPITTVETMRVLESLPAGSVLEVISDYYPARGTIPYLCAKRDQPCTLTDPDTSGAWRARIERR